VASRFWRAAPAPAKHSRTRLSGGGKGNRRDIGMVVATTSLHPSAALAPWLLVGHYPFLAQKGWMIKTVSGSGHLERWQGTALT
jgi:hypothetical protein